MTKLTYNGPFWSVDVIHQGDSYTAPNGSEVEFPDELAALLSEGQSDQWEATAATNTPTTGAKTAGEEN